MSKPDSAGGNLESILASIRRSLSEQSTDALTEDAPAAAAPPPPVEDRNGAKPPRREGLAQRLAGATSPPSPDAAERADDLAGLVEEAPARTAPAPASVSASASAAAVPAADPVSPAVPATPAAAPVAASTSAAAPAAAERSESDPLWFLTPGPEPEASKAAEPPSASGEPTLRPEVLRATMPPFFGSSAEAVKAEVALAAAPPQAAAVSRAPAARPDTARRGGEAEPAKAAARAVVADSAPVPTPAPAAEAAVHSTASAAASPKRNGRVDSHSEPAAEAPAVAPTVSKATVFGDSPNAHALEAVVVDMLRPMLREWLDDNMPRLVASALADEAAARARTRDPRKS